MFRLFSVGLVLLLISPTNLSSAREIRLRSLPSLRQNIQKCGDQKVGYSAFDPFYSKRIVFVSVTDSDDHPETAHKEYSPNKDMWRAVVDPDTSKPGPWNTNIYFGSDSNEEVWKLTFIADIGADAHWLNEKLVFGQVWWGHILATDYVLDVQQHKFIYREMANYGATVQPCE
jgi:hypothetical protein